jgi:hypothetical protein
VDIMGWMAAERREEMRMGLGIGHGLNDDPERRATIRTATVHRVVGNTDLTEGRGASFTLGWFLDHGTATRFADGRGVMGTAAYIESKTEQVVQVVDGAGQPIAGECYILGEQLWTPEKAASEARQRALAKLTPEDRRALGLP